jgi:AraC-like DNA-binding protein
VRRLTHPPRPPLADRVAFFWTYDAYGGGHPRERVLPTATSELVVALADDGSVPVVSGAHSESFLIHTASRRPLLGVHFRPGGAAPFLTMPAHELRNVRVSLEALWGPAAPALKSRLLEAHTPPARFRIMEDALLARLGERPRRHPAVAFALDTIEAAPHVRTIAGLTARIGLSPRRFIQVFAEEVGLTPKVFCRVRRFQRVLARIERGARVDWADVAVAGGYYDQAHFIRDFRAFSGLNPTAYLRTRGPHRNHVPLAD